MNLIRNTVSLLAAGPGVTLNPAAGRAMARPDEAAWQLTEALLVEMWKTTEEQGIKLLVVVTPSAQEVIGAANGEATEDLPYSRTVSICQRRDIKILSLAPQFLSQGVVALETIITHMTAIGLLEATVWQQRPLPIISPAIQPPRRGPGAFWGGHRATFATM